MAPLLGLLLILPLGATLGGADPLGAARVAAAREVAARDAGAPPALFVDDPRSWSIEPLGWSWQERAPSSPRGPSPIFQARQPEEWIGAVSRRLGIEDTRLARAALWVVNAPVRVDVSTRHVFVALRFKAP